MLDVIAKDVIRSFVSQMMMMMLLLLATRKHIAKQYDEHEEAVSRLHRADERKLIATGPSSANLYLEAREVDELSRALYSLPKSRRRFL